MENNLLKKWYLRRIGNSVVACGEIYNDGKGRFADGTFVRTSRIINADFERGIIQTRNSVYRLDKENENG